MPDWVKWLELAGRVAAWVIESVGAYIAGSDAEPVRRLVNILPTELKSDVEHARQRELTRAALEEELRDDG